VEPLRHRRPLRAGRARGFKGIGLWHADLEHILETRTLDELKTLLDDHGLEHLELECLLDWFLDPSDENRRAADATRELLFEAAAVLEPHHIKVANIFSRPVRPVGADRALRELCAEARSATGARMVYEFYAAGSQRT
jgi:sugar phosphate isomerase/epimerase